MQKILTAIVKIAKPIIVKIRAEAVVIAGVITSVLNVVLANGHVLSAIIPIVLSLITRTQVSPQSKVNELISLIRQLRLDVTAAKASAGPAVPPAKPVK